MAQIYSRVYTKEIKLGRREQLIMLEIEKDHIDTASSFVEYMEENYGFSRSSTWYCLNRLREQGLAEFANKEQMGKPLSLTKQGLAELGKLQVNRNELVNSFSNSFLEEGGTYTAGTRYLPVHIRNRDYALYR